MRERAAGPPDGIEEVHERPTTGWRRHASPISLLILGAVVLLAMSGALGRERDWQATSAGGSVLSVHAPEIIRNGEFLEMRIVVAADEPIDSVSIGIEASLWEDLTVNTMIPAPTSEEFRDGQFRFGFGRLEAGNEFLLKIDLQVNPDIVAGNDGRLTLFDGDEPMAAVDLSLIVLP